MRKSGKNMLYLTIIILSIAIFILIGVIINISNINKEIKKQEESESLQLGETTDNAYVSMETHLSEINTKQQEINNMQNLSGQATVTAGQILKDYTAYKDGKLITGTMANNGAVTKTLNAGENYTIPEGYHNGSGKVTAKSLESQTQATATADNISKGKTAWVNGELITGNGADNNQYVQQNNYKKIEYLGSASTFDLSNYDGYNSFTSSNFIVGITSSSIGCDTYMAGNGNVYSYTIAPVYNSSTGLLTISLTPSSSASSCAFYNFSTNYHVYLIY